MTCKFCNGTGRTETGLCPNRACDARERVVKYQISTCRRCGTEIRTIHDHLPSMCPECEAAGRTEVMISKPAMSPPVDLVDQVVQLRAEVSRLKRERDALKKACSRHKAKWKRGWWPRLKAIRDGWELHCQEKDKEIDRLQQLVRDVRNEEFPFVAPDYVSDGGERAEAWGKAYDEETEAMIRGEKS